MTRTLSQAVKWGLKAVGGLAANIALLTFWVDHVGLSPEVAIVPNFVLISAIGYSVTNRWIWPDGVSPSTWVGHARQYGGMQLANLSGKLANYIFYLVLLPIVDYRLAWIVGAIVTFAITFGLNKIWWEQSAVAESA